MNGKVVSVTDRASVHGVIVTLCVGFLCGCIGVLVDIDHAISFAIGIEDARFLHPYYLVVGCLIIFSCVAYITGLLFRDVLRSKQNG